jgi:hypothetical protein
VRASVYVDGFNLYFGIKHYEQQYGRLYKWLDIGALCQHERPADTIQRIRYCTARVRPRPNNPSQGSRQEIYLRALVNLATLMLCDGFANDYDLAVLISNDSDLVMPIDVVRTQLQKKVAVLNPGQQFSNALNKAADSYLKISEQALASCQFPSAIVDARGRTITKPISW